MTSGHPITLDCAIFGIQRFGGVSNYWAKIVEHVSVDPSLSGRLILPKHLKYCDFEDAWIRCMPVRRETLDVRIGRYLRAPADSGVGVFHTPYYRLPRQQFGKYVVTVHDFTYERYRTGLARFVHTKQKLASIRRADAVLCVSESTRRDVIEFCPGVDAAKLHVIHHGVDGKAFYQELAGPSDADEQTVLFVGQRGGYKRFDLAVEAVRQSPRLSLGVVGPTLMEDERTHLQQRLGTRWHEFGPVSTSDLRRLYSSAFAFIFPSDYEGFGLPILEAMACGCPVVVAALSSLPEVGGNVAYYAESQSGESYASALGALDSVVVREVAVRGGIERAAEFDWLQTFQKTKAVYLDL
jgi:mannosyltransferase